MHDSPAPADIAPPGPASPGPRRAGADALRVRLLWHPQPQFAGYLLAGEAGRHGGVAVSCVPMRFDIGPIEHLLSGGVEFAVASPAHMLESGRADDLVLLLAIQQASALVYPARREAGIGRVADLAGRRIGVWPGRENLELRWMLARNGVSPDTVTFVPVADTVSALLDGTVDCAQMTVYHEIHHLEAREGSMEPFALFRAADHGAALVKDGLVARRGWVADHPADTQAFVEAALAGWTRAFRQPDEALDLTMRIRPDMGRAEQAAQLADIARLSLTGATLVEGLGYPDPMHMARACAAMAAVEPHAPQPVQAGLVDARFWQAAPADLRSPRW